MTDKQRQLIGNADYLHDIFPIERVIRLYDDAYPIGEIDWIVPIGESFFILDGMQRQVLLFDQDGRFKKLVGRIGQGPGEYQSPAYMSAIWGDQLAVADLMGRLLVFDKKGEHQFTLSLRKGHIIPTTRFAWPEPSRLYATQFHGPRSEHLVQIMDYTNLDKGVKGPAFETRHPYHLEFPEVLVYESFCLVDNHVWSSNQFESKINIYSSMGKLEKSFEPGLSEPKTYEYVVKMRRKYGENNPIHKERPDVIWVDQVGNLVIANTEVGFLVYDTDGNRLTKTLPPTTAKIYGVMGNSIITLLSEVNDLPLESRRALFASSMADAYPLMKELGYDIEDEQDDTIYLRVGTLAE